jgi:hypothetical protein
MDEINELDMPSLKNKEETNYNDYERSSMDCPISSSNIGYKLLKKMGWSEGKGLGPELEGRVDPIRIEIKEDFWGVGKDEEMNSYYQMVTSKPKPTQTEIIANETEEEKKIREEKVRQEEELKKELKAINSVFYCSLCNKQYAKISEYEQHLDSYDHNHKKRFMEMRKTEKLNNKKREGDKKRLKEQKRNEKEMQMLNAFASKQQGIIDSSNRNMNVDIEKGIKTIKSSNKSGGGWVSSFESIDNDNDEKNLTKDISSKGTPGWKSSFTLEENNSESSNSGWTSPTKDSETSKSSGIKFSFGMKKIDNSVNTSTTTNNNKTSIGFSINKKPRTGPIKFKFNK